MNVREAFGRLAHELARGQDIRSAVKTVASEAGVAPVLEADGGERVRGRDVQGDGLRPTVRPKQEKSAEGRGR